jgi:NAD-dependent SIR2 family protein deacetylase
MPQKSKRAKKITATIGAKLTGSSGYRDRLKSCDICDAPILTDEQNTSVKKHFKQKHPERLFNLRVGNIPNRCELPKLELRNDPSDSTLMLGKELLLAIERRKSVVVLTGAGVSVADPACMPTFRGGSKSLHNQYVDLFKEPKGGADVIRTKQVQFGTLWKDYVEKSRPNINHRWLVSAMQNNLVSDVYDLNVDGLLRCAATVERSDHLMANVQELHGCLDELICCCCGYSRESRATDYRIMEHGRLGCPKCGRMSDNLVTSRSGDFQLIKKTLRGTAVRMSERTNGGLLIPRVVWTESTDVREFALPAMDVGVIIVIGCSLEKTVQTWRHVLKELSQAYPEAIIVDVNPDMNGRAILQKLARRVLSVYERAELVFSQKCLWDIFDNKE